MENLVNKCNYCNNPADGFSLNLLCYVCIDCLFKQVTELFKSKTGVNNEN